MYSLPFFDRLDRDDLKKLLPHFKVEYYEMDEIVFLEKRIGVISFGSVRLIDHSKNVLNPFIIGRYKKGRILCQN
jgi:signal-transduction protein with cAMP-binding, CBS, and nucleotidyltransferase domain